MDRIRFFPCLLNCLILGRARPSTETYLDMVYLIKVKFSLVPIQSFADRKARKLFEAGKVEKGTKWAGIKKIVLRKLDMLHYAAELKDMASPPGNCLEALTRDLLGYHSIRINGQWRIVFRWTTSGPSEVRVTDYH